MTTVAGISNTTVSTSQLMPLGFEMEVPKGDEGVQVWVYIQAATALAIGEIVSRAAGASTLALAPIAPTNTATIAVAGVTQHAIAALSYGFIMKKGMGEVFADTGGITADTGLKVGNVVAGRADNIAAGDHAFAVSTEIAAAAALATCFINC